MRFVWVLRHRWENNIIMDLRGIGCDGVDWIQVLQGRVQLLSLVNIVMDLLVP
jgi:hypothetical protein